MIAIFLGAGFSKSAGIPLASELFNTLPQVDRITRQKLVQKVTSYWESWHKQTKGTAEEFLAFLEKKGGKDWIDAVWYVGLAITLPLANLQYVGSNLTITKHNVDRTTSIETHEAFWKTIFTHTQDISVITTNYDILAERGIRHEPKPKIHRPGFHYGHGSEYLEGGGYPSYSHIQRITISGSVPLIKLHGSISWSLKNNQLIHYHDCRPAIRGNAAILAPITNKQIPSYLNEYWDQARNFLSSSNTWFIIGYSLPSYDMAVRNLFIESSGHKPTVHVFDPNSSVFDSFAKLLPQSIVHGHQGIPECMDELNLILKGLSS